jgi:hypothetical protein
MRGARLLEIITNPQGRVSTSDSTLVGAFLVSSVVLIWCAATHQMNDLLFGAYLGAWVAHSGVSRFGALQQDRINKEFDHPAPGTPKEAPHNEPVVKRP